MQKNVVMHHSQKQLCTPARQPQKLPSFPFSLLAKRCCIPGVVAISEAGESPALQMKCRLHGGSAVSGYVWLNIHMEK